MSMNASTLERTTAKAETESRVLSEAVARAAANWGLSDTDLGTIIGVSRTSAGRLSTGEFKLRRGKPEFQLGQYFVRVFRSLDSLTGSDDETSISWLGSHNLDLGDSPLNMMRSIGGLVRVADYIDDYRAKV